MHSSSAGSVEGRGAKEASKGNEFFYSEFGILKIILNFAPRFERKSVPDRDGAIAQLVEQRTENPCVPGSIPGGTTRKELSRDNSFLFYPESEFHRHNPVRRSATVKRLPDRSKRIELCSETPLSTAGEANIDLQFFIFGFNSYFCKIIYILET